MEIYTNYVVGRGSVFTGVFRVVVNFVNVQDVLLLIRRVFFLLIMLLLVVVILIVVARGLVSVMIPGC